MDNKFIQGGENPEGAAELPPQMMFEYDNHTNIPWNIPQYQPVREYLDPQKQVEDRKFKEQKKGDKDRRYLIKKGFYMDYHLKVVKALPAPGDHHFSDFWDQTLNKKVGDRNKIDPKLKKYTYIERIEMEEKNRKKPAPGSYSLNKTDKEIKADLDLLKTKRKSVGQKEYFYQDTQYLSNLVPGAGSHNPHLEVDHLRTNKTDHKFWIKKHEGLKMKLKKRRLSEPDPGTYRPCSVQVGTFDRIQKLGLANKNKKASSTGFGMDSKFPYDRPNKKKIMEQRPASCTYNMHINWRAKNTDMKQKSWIESRSTGFSQGVYN